MRSTEVGVLSWSETRRQRQQLSFGIFRLPSSPLWLVVVLMPLIRASASGAVEQIGIKPLDCCGMRQNTSQCWTNLACVCEDCGNRTQDLSGSFGSYRLEFCSSFPIIKALDGAFLQNRTLCQEQINILRRVDNEAYQSYKNFEGIVERTDCGDTEKEHTYSATSTCRDCLEAYKNWICFTTLLEVTKSKTRACVDLCETVLQKCPHLQPVPNDGGNLVQVGYSAFNCLELKESYQERNFGDCLQVDPMVECQQNNNTSIIQPTLFTTTTLSTSNSTSNSTSSGGR